MSHQRHRPFCAGCGLSFATHGQHRADCTAPEIVRLRLFSASRHDWSDLLLPACIAAEREAQQ